MKNTLLFVCLVVAFICSCWAHGSHKCVHDEILEKNPQLRSVRRFNQRYTISRHELSRMTEAQQQTEYKNIRITFIYDILDREGITSAQRAVVQTFFPQLQQIAANLLSVIPVSGNLKLPSSTSCSLSYDSSYSTTGIANTDLAIFVTARQSTGTEIAWAVACAADQSFRPILGQINLNPNVFFGSTLNSNIRQGTVLHELTHILGFSSSMFQYYRDSNTGIRRTVTTTGTRTNNGATQTVTKVITPNALAAAREHFNCATLDGVELEEYGGSGSAGSHWEMRMYMDELMIAAAYWGNPGDGVAHVSALTLGLLQDSGWYKSNFTAAQPMKWLSKFGCKAQDNCNSWGSPASTGYYGLYCSEYYTSSSSYSRQCNYNHDGKGYCNSKLYSTNLPAFYQYFSNPSVGGDQWFDFCPIVFKYSNGACTDPANAGSSAAQYGETYSATSKCFPANTISTQYVAQSGSDARCFDTRCATDGKLYFKVGSNWYKCPNDNAVVSGISGFSGSVTCPKFHLICNSNSTIFTPVPTTSSGSGSGGGGNNPFINLFGSAPQASELSKLTVLVCLAALAVFGVLL